MVRNRRTAGDDFTSVDCARWMDALSAISDGEATEVDPRLIQRHLAGCPSCRAHEQELALTDLPMALAQPAPPTRLIRSSIAAADRASRPLLLRGLLALIGIEIVVFALRPLIVGDDIASVGHPVRHVGAFTLAYGVAMLATVVRPARAGAILPISIVLVGAIAMNVILDIRNDATSLTAEWAHIPELLSVPLVWLLSRPPTRWTSYTKHRSPSIHLARGAQPLRLTPEESR